MKLDYTVSFLPPHSFVDMIRRYVGGIDEVAIDPYTSYWFHCTLMFLSNVNKSNELAIIAALEDIEIGPFKVMTGRMAILNRSLTVLLHRSHLLRLHQEIFNRLRKYSGNEEDLRYFSEKYNPHIALFRITESLNQALLNENEFVGHVLPVYRIELSRRDDIWKTIRTFPLG